MSMDNEEIKRRRAQLEQEDKKLEQEENIHSEKAIQSKGDKQSGKSSGKSREDDSDEESSDDLDVGSEGPDIDGEEDGEYEEDSEDVGKDENLDDEKDNEQDSENDDKGFDENDNKVDSESRKKLGPNRENEDSDNKDKSSSSDDKDQNLSQKLTGKALEKMSGKLGEQSGMIAKAKGAATAIVSAAKSFVSGIAFVGKLLFNPIFWIAIVILILIVAIFSGMSIMGGNDYNKACDDNGVGSVLVADDADEFTRQSAIASWLMSTPFKVTGDQPMNKEQAAAIVGNLSQESYGANPKTIGGDYSMTQWETCDNNCILSWGGSGPPVGIAQWTGGRRTALVKLAQKEGTQWYDLTTQLKYLKMELDGEGAGGTYELNQLSSGNWNGNHSLEEYTWIWQKYFERAGESRNSAPYQNRERYAQEFYAKFDGAGISAGSLATQCVGGSGVIDASNLTQLALQISYTREEKAARMGYGLCDTLNNCGDGFSKPEYIQAKKLAEEQTGADGFPGLTASCDRLVATLVRLTGMDTNFPWGGTAVQIDYMNSNPDWVNVSCQERQVGDVIARPGHIMIYIGKVDGRDTISSASIALRGRADIGRAAHLSDLSCKGDTWFADNGNAQGWRKVR